jgi:hypothetical protein
MWAKAYAIIDAWFSPDDRPLLFLRDHHGVTHFFIENARRADRFLSYFRPFNEYIAKKRVDDKERWIDAPPTKSVIFENNDFVIVDLGRIGGLGRKPTRCRIKDAANPFDYVPKR